MSTADNPNTPPRPQRIISSVIIQNTPPQRVWEAITQPDFTSQYFFGSRVEVTEDEPGRLRYLSPDGKEVWGDGAILESDPPQLLVVEWRSLYLPDAAHEPASRVTWQLEPWTDGATKLTVTHDRLEDSPVTAQNVASPRGWSFVLAGLKRVLETGE